MENKPLFSVGVITYNSAQYVLETLESIKRQTYPNIELIVSDDCSSDNTVEVVQEWCEKNKERFARVQIITTPENTGVSKNFNRALFATTGEYVKLLAGDDLFFDDSIETYYSFFQKNPDVAFFLTFYTMFNGDYRDKDYTEKRLRFEYYVYGPKATAKRQNFVLNRIFTGCGQTLCYKRKEMMDIGGFDDVYRYVEDHPTCIRITKAGYKIHLLKESTVLYRNNDTSISHEKQDNQIFPKYWVRQIREYKYPYFYNNYNGFWRMLHEMSYRLRKKVVDTGNDRKNRKCRYYYKLYRIADPFVNYGRYLSLVNKIAQYTNKH